MSYYLIKPCRTTAGYISTLKRNIKLDLEECYRKLRKAGYKVTDVKVMLILEGEVELTLYQSGKVLAKTDDDKSARKAIQNVYKLLDIGV